MSKIFNNIKLNFLPYLFLVCFFVVQQGQAAFVSVKYVPNTVTGSSYYYDQARKTNTASYFTALPPATLLSITPTWTALERATASVETNTTNYINHAAPGANRYAGDEWRLIIPITVNCIYQVDFKITFSVANGIADLDVWNITAGAFQLKNSKTSPALTSPVTLNWTLTGNITAYVSPNGYVDFILIYETKNKALQTYYSGVTVTYYTIPNKPTINAVSTPTNNKTQVVTGSMASDTITINVTCTPSATISSVSYPTTTSWRVTISAMAEGTSNVSVNAENPAGTSNYATTAIFVDSIAPTWPTFNNLPATISVTSYTVTGTAETNSLVSLYLDTVLKATANATGGVFTITVNGLANGRNTINATATDALNNVSPTKSSYIYISVTLPLSPTFNNLPATINTTSYAVTGTAEANNIVKLYIDTTFAASGNASAGGTFNITISGLAQNRNTINATATDVSNNVSPTKSSYIFIDSVTPSVPVFNNLPASINTTSYAVAGTAEASSIVKLYLGAIFAASANATVGGTFNITVTGLTQNINTINGTATDALGNISNTASSTIFVDTVTPSIPVYGNLPATINTTSYIVTGTAEIDSVVKIYIGVSFAASASAAAGNFSITINGLTEGSNSINVTATDALNNVSNTASSTIFVDTVTPSAPVYGNLPITINTTSYLVTGTAEAESIVSIYIEDMLDSTGNADTGGNFSIPIHGLSLLNNNIKATARDSAGNISATASSTIYVEIFGAYTITVTPNAVGAGDNTTDLLADIIANNGLTTAPGAVVQGDGAYTTLKSGSGQNAMFLDGFDISRIPSGSLLLSVQLELNYGTQSGYSGPYPVQYALHGQTLQTTGIDVNNTGGSFTVTQSADLFANGVTNSAQIETLDVSFSNGSNKVSSFDFLWLKVNLITPPNRPTINPVSSPTKNNSQLLTGIRSIDTTAVSVSCQTSSVDIVSYPTSTSWQVTLNNLSEGDNPISVNASNPAGSSSYATANIFVDSIAPSAPIYGNLPATISTISYTVTGTAEASAIVKLYIGSTFAASANASAGGTFNITITGLTLNVNTINGTATDALGNISATASSTIVVSFGFVSLNIQARWMEFLVPTASGYTGSTSIMVPGSRIRYYTSIQNTGNITANGCILRDLIPQNTHLYYTETPTLTGNVANVVYQGASTNTAGPGSEVKFQFDLGPTGNSTFKYTVTAD